jgi:hypothetical protein
LVERLAGGLFTSTDIREVNEHGQHVSIEVTGQISSTDIRVVNEHGQHVSIEVKGGAPRRATASTELPPVSNRALAARRVAKEPIDALYDQLTNWLLDDTEQFLMACASCGRFFLQRTPASTTCSPTCRRQVDPALKKNNAEYQQRFRRKQIDKDLARVREAKAQWLERTGNLPRLRTLLGVLGMSRKRWATLQKADREQHGTLHDTALTKPAWELRQRRRTPSRNPPQTTPTDMAPPISKTEPSVPLLPAPRPRQRRQDTAPVRIGR